MYEYFGTSLYMCLCFFFEGLLAATPASARDFFEVFSPDALFFDVYDFSPCACVSAELAWFDFGDLHSFVFGHVNFLFADRGQQAHQLNQFRYRLA